MAANGFPAICVLHTCICLTLANSRSCSITSVRMCCLRVSVFVLSMLCVCVCERSCQTELCRALPLCVRFVWRVASLFPKLFYRCYKFEYKCTDTCVRNNKIKCHSMRHVKRCVAILPPRTRGLKADSSSGSRLGPRTWRRKTFRKTHAANFSILLRLLLLPFKQLSRK